MFKKFFSLSFILIVLISVIFSQTDSNSNSYYIYPANTEYISSPYGYREIFGSVSFHDGIDFPLTQGSDVNASKSGVVRFVGFLNGYGNTVILLHDNGEQTLYCHLDSLFLVKTGQHVMQSEIIAKVGPKYLENGILNGFTTGPHLHFSIFDKNGNSIDPLKYITKK